MMAQRHGNANSIARLIARELRQSNTAPTPRPPRKSKSTTADDLTEQGEKS